MNLGTASNLAMAALGSVLLLGGATACGSNVLVNGDDDTGGSGGTGGTTTTTSITTTGSGAHGGGGNGGAGGADSCATWNDEQGSYSVTLRFRNDSGWPIYLPAHCGVVLYDLQADAGGDVSYGFDPFCLQTCEDLQTQPIMDCGDCAPTSILLPPNAVRDVVWDGTGLRSAPMPIDCWFDPYQQSSCPQILAAEPGSYRINANGYGSCGSGACACDASGVCNGDATGTEAYADPTQFTFPGTALVEVVFGVCAFPCPS